MKKIMMSYALLLLAPHAFAAAIETIEIVKPIVPLREAVIDAVDGFPPSSGAAVQADPSGSFQSTFESKGECVAWVKASVSTLTKSRKVIYSASCTNKDLAPLYLDAGHFVGYVGYL